MNVVKLCVFILFHFLFANCQITKLFPIKYDLTLTPYFENETQQRFEGRLVFIFRPLEHNKLRSIVLHADDLEIQSSFILEDFNNVTKQLCVSSVFNKEKQLLSFTLENNSLAVERNYELHINYSGRIADDGWGLYKESYKEGESLRYYIVTQLRPIFARRLLPCLDEPSYKARFTVRVWRLPHYTTRSNMPCIDTSPINSVTGRVLDTFAETPLMSTFLLALTVFEFSSITSPDKRFSTWTVPAKIHLAEHGQKMLPEIVKAMERITDSKFNMPKLDQIALPRLNPVAMENWGMNTYREVYMLYKEGKFPPRVRQDVPRFTGHEVAHHWLGNLVTLQWWDWLWISEMYGMYYEYYLPSQVMPGWRMADQMVVDLIIPGLLEDSFNKSNPLTTHVSTNTEILGKFSGVTYTKGPALVLMINNFMTQSSAERAIRTLLREKKFGTVNPQELWHIYDLNANGLPAKMEIIMNSWTDQAGYPLVTVTVDQEYNSITLQQERFLLDSTSSSSPLWWIPLTYTIGSSPNFNDTMTKVWLTPRNPVIVLNLNHYMNSWVLFNLQHIGFYRVNYDEQNWDKLVNSLRSDPSNIHELNRAQLLDDTFALARASRLSYTVPLHLATYLRREGCYFPWAAVIPSIQFLLMRLNGHSFYEPFKEYLKQLIEPAYNSVGFYLRHDDTHLIELNRVQLVSLACSIGLPKCVHAAQHHEKLVTQRKASLIPPGLEFIQLCTVLESGVSGQGIFHQLTTWPEEDQVKAMPCVANKTVLIGYLNRSLQQESATQWDAKLKAAISRPANIDPVFNFLLSQYQVLLTRFGTSTAANSFTQMEDQLSTTPQLNKVRALKTEVRDEQLRKTLSTITDSLDTRLKWIAKRAHTIKSWLRSYNTNLMNNGPLAYCS